MRSYGALVFWPVLIWTIQGCAGTDQRSDVEEDRIESISANDEKLDIPKPGEWRFEKKEKRQTFDHYKKSKPVRITSANKKIYIQPIGQFTSWQDSVIYSTSSYLQIFFALEVEVLPSIRDTILSSSARRRGGTILIGDTTSTNSNQNEQLLSGAILNYLEKNIPHDGIVIMAITEKDLYPSDDWNFVFGQARTTKRVAVSSIYRYTQEPLGLSNYNQCLERLIKTCAHEIGHMFGCHHCTYRICLMNGSNSLSESDSRPNRLCSECLRKLQWNLGWDLTERSQNLVTFFDQHNLAKDYELTLNDWKQIRD